MEENQFARILVVDDEDRIRRLLRMYLERENYEIKGYLLGQLGKNFDNNALATNSVCGADLLKMATDSMMDAYRATGGRIFYLECEDEPKLKSFYTKQGFREIESYKSQNDLCIFVRRIE